MACVQVRTLGTVRIEVEGRVIGPSAGRPFALLFYLTSRRGQGTPRRLIQELLYPDAKDNRSGHSLRELLYRLRKLGVPLRTDAEIEIAEPNVWVDWSDILERGELGSPDLELIAKGLFLGYTPDVSEGYRDWFEAERSNIRLRLSRAVGLQLTQLRRAARWDLVEVAARAMLALDPLSEEGALARAEVLAASGSKAAALRVIDDYLEELGEGQANLRIAPAALRRRISERLPELGHRAQDDRIFVGREDAMRMLSAAGAAARAGSQQTVLVWGEPGIGKTRLLTEYKALACLQGALAFQCTCQPHDVFRPLGILSDLVAQLLEAPGALGCDPAGRELLARLATGHNTASAAEHQSIEAPLDTIVGAFDDLLSAIAAEATLLIVVDDAHWVDPLSKRLLLMVFAAKSSRRACLAFASRERSLLSNDSGLADTVISIRLTPLRPEAAMVLTRHLLPPQATSVDDELAAKHVLEQARGNPFFIKHLSLHFGMTGDHGSAPRTVADIFERRLEQLSSDGIKVLEGSVVLGKNCSFARLEQLLGINRLNLLRAVEELDDRGLIEVRDGCFVGGHALISAAVTKRISDPLYRALHAAAAELLFGELASGESGSLPWDCAEHWRVACNPAKAVAVLQDCARRALQIGRPDDAFATIKRSLEFEIPDGTRLEIVEDALRLMAFSMDRRDTMAFVSERNRLRARLNRPATPHDSFELVEAAGDYHTDRDPTGNIPRLRSCVSAIEASASHRLEAARQLLMIAELTLDTELAKFAYESTVSETPSVVSRLSTDLLYHTWFGVAERAREIALQLGALDLCDDPQRLGVWLNAGYALYRVGASSEAEATLLRSLNIAQKCGMASGQMNASMFLARLCWSNRRIEESQKWLDNFQALFEEHPDPGVVGEMSIVGAHVAISQNRLEDADRWLSKAQSCRQSTLPLPRLLSAACSIRLRSARGRQPCKEAELEELLSLHVRARNVGLQDDVMLAMILALNWFGRRAEATKLREEYLWVYRRDGFEAPPEFRTLSHE